MGWTALSGEVLNLPDVYQLAEDLPYHFDPSVDQELGYRAVSVLCCTDALHQRPDRVG